jgi:hypothetical protein
MKKSNVRIASNIYPAKTVTRDSADGETRELISKGSNEAYFREIADHEVLKTACDSCSCTCDSCMKIGDISEKPWGRVRVGGELVDICKCQRTSCRLFYSDCRPDLEKP